MKQIVIRKCTVEDVPAIYILNLNEMGYKYSFEQTAQELEQFLSKSSE